MPLPNFKKFKVQRDKDASVEFEDVTVSSEILEDTEALYRDYLEFLAAIHSKTKSDVTKCGNRLIQDMEVLSQHMDSNAPLSVDDFSNINAIVDKMAWGIASTSYLVDERDLWERVRRPTPALKALNEKVDRMGGSN